MSKNTQVSNKIDFIHIDCDQTYFNTEAQVRLRNATWFKDSSAPFRLSGSSGVSGLFSREQPPKDQEIFNSPSYPTSSTAYDSSGAPRSILSARVDYFASSSIDTYKNGVEITQPSQWAAGLVKITAGTPGHLYHVDRYGDNDDLNLFSDTSFTDTNKFSPVEFIASGADADVFHYPFAVYPDVNPQEVLDGILEPFPLRPVINRFSIDIPESRGVFGDLSQGNVNVRRNSDQILTVDYFTPTTPNAAVFLDGGSLIPLVVSGNLAQLGKIESLLSEDYNVVPPYEDVSYPRGAPPSAATKISLSGALDLMSPGGTTYVSWKQRSSTTGHVYDDANLGTDSIAFGGRYADKYYGNNEISRARQRKTVLTLRDSQPFLAETGAFDEKKMHVFNTQLIQYPEMLPTDYLMSTQTPQSSSISKLYHTGSIEVRRSYLPGMFDSILKDRLIKDDV